MSLDEIDSMILDELNVPSASIGKDDELLILVTEAEQQSVVEKFVRAKIPVTGTVLRTLVIDEFPVNDGGKILYGKLAEEYL